MFFLETPPTRSTVALSEMGCQPIDKDSSSTYEINGTIALANRAIINDLISKLPNPSFPYRTIVCDDYYAVGNDEDPYAVYWGAFGGGEWRTPGAYDDFRWDNSPASANLWPRSSGGLVYCGDNNGVLFEFHGAYAKLDLCLLGTYFNTTTGVQDRIDSECAQTLIKCQNIVDPDQDPSGLKSEFRLMFPIGRDGIAFENTTGSSYTDSPITWSIYSKYLSGTLYKVNEDQSLQHLIIKAGTSGYTMERMFSLIRGGSIHCVEAYHPNGVLAHLGPGGAGALSSSAAQILIDKVQLDSNFGISNVALVECEAGSQGSQVIIGNINTTYTTATVPDKQLIRRLESTAEDNSTQPDIQIYSRNLSYVEQCAHPRRAVRGEPFDAEYFYPYPIIPNTKLRIRASDQTDWVKHSPDGQRWNTGDIVASIEDLSGTQPTLTASSSGNGPKFVREGTNWRPSLDFNWNGTTNHHLVVTVPVDLDDGPSELFGAAIYTDRQASLANDSYIFACRNANNTGGFGLLRRSTGQIRFFIDDTNVDTPATIDAGRPYLILFNWDGTNIDLWVEGAKTEGTESTLGSVSGHLVIGGTQTAATPTYAGCRGRISELLIAETSLDIDADSGGAPDLANWDAPARQLVQYYRSQYAVR